MGRHRLQESAGAPALQLEQRRTAAAVRALSTRRRCVDDGTRHERAPYLQSRTRRRRCCRCGRNSNRARDRAGPVNLRRRRPDVAGGPHVRNGGRANAGRRTGASSAICVFATQDTSSFLSRRRAIRWRSISEELLAPARALTRKRGRRPCTSSSTGRLRGSKIRPWSSPNPI